MRILFFGDIVGKNGRNAIKRNLGLLKSKFRADLVIANGENATHGKGLIENHYNELIEAGIDIITLGNHYLSKSEITEYIQHANRLVRPLNIKSDIGGYGSVVIDIDDISIRVTNVLGQVFLHEEVENPFDSLDQLINNSERANIHIVDFHAEATGEKQALAWAFDGKVSAVLGTHTHVQTNDNRILENGTGYISDVGMCGPYNGVLGVKKEAVIARSWHGEKARFETDDFDESIINAVIMDINNDGKCQSIQTISFVDSNKHK